MPVSMALASPWAGANATLAATGRERAGSAAGVSMQESWGVARLLAGVVLVAVVAAGCGGGGGGVPAAVEEGTPTPTPVPPSVPTAAARPTETPAPTIGPSPTPEPRASGIGQTFTSPLYNYDI